MTNLFPHAYALIGLLVSLATCIGIVVTKPLHSRHSLDQSHGIQRMHSSPTPRVGGVALAMGCVAAWLTLEGEAQLFFGALVLAGIPALGFGLAEDITKSVGVFVRLAAAVLAGILFPLLSGYPIVSVGLWWFDPLLNNPVFAVAFTAFAIGTATNAINLIDGFHGLASGTVLIMLTAIAMVAAAVGDSALFQVTLAVLGVTAGFFLVNFPFGKIFLGDGGAYFLGYLVAALTVVLPSRNPEISPWICPLILSYPLAETIVSIARRLRGEGKSFRTWNSNNQHLHHIVYRILKRKIIDSEVRSEVLGHALTSLTLWTVPLASLVLVAVSGYEAKFAFWATISVYVIYMIVDGIAYRHDRKSVGKSGQ